MKLDQFLISIDIGIPTLGSSLNYILVQNIVELELYSNYIVFELYVYFRTIFELFELKNISNKIQTKN